MIVYWRILIQNRALCSLVQRGLVLIQRADGFLKNSHGGFTESLNISVSAAIIIQNLTNRLRKLISIGIYPKILVKRLAWAKNSIKDIKRIEARYFEENPK
jgi:tRNA (guanosine-2'-O-)-methyltransferase